MKHYFLGREYSDTIVNLPNAKRVYSDFELSIMQGIYDSLSEFYFGVIWEFRQHYENKTMHPWEISAEDFMEFMGGSYPAEDSELQGLINYLVSLDSNWG